MLSLSSLLKTAADTECPVDFIQHRCLRKRLNTNDCSRCLNVCKPGALSLQGREITFDNESCIECMACVSVCPQEAMKGTLDLSVLLKNLSKRSNTLITCERKKQIDPDEIAIPCMGLISKQLLIAMALSGCSVLHFDLSGCSECQNNHAAKLFRNTFDEVMGAISGIIATHMHIVESTTQISAPQFVRRRYLANLKNTLSTAAQNHLGSDENSVSTPPRQSRWVPEKVAMIQKLIKSLDNDAQLRILFLLGHTLEVSDDCNCCPLCKGICPTGAITIERNEQGKKFKFDTLLCSGCGLCVEFCKKDSLKLSRFSAGKL